MDIKSLMNIKEKSGEVTNEIRNYNLMSRLLVLYTKNDVDQNV